MTNVTLKASHHDLIIGLFPERESVSKINYILQCTKIWNSEIGYVEDMDMPVVIDDDLIVYTFDLMAEKQSGIVAVVNDEIEKMLMPQLEAQGKTELMLRLGEIAERNRGRRNAIRESGRAFAKSIQIPV